MAKAVLPAAARVHREMKMNRSAMTMQAPVKLAGMQARVVPGIIRISGVVRIGDKSG
jgi:poly-beta-hydroxyalkanoate depolymerase